MGATLLNENENISMLQEIEAYWNKRAESYSENVRFEMEHDNERAWMDVLEQYLKGIPGKKVLDIGTGPGFFAIGLAKRGYQVTAVDYTPNMLEEAKKNAGSLAEKITFLQMDAQNLDFDNAGFDAIVTRNLTWNLEHPADAYREWHRVLKKGGVLLNFDAGWYSYLFDDEKAQSFEEDRKRVKDAQIKDYEEYSESDKMEAISRNLILSLCKRPQTDIELMRRAGFRLIFTDERIGDRVWDEEEKVNFASRPMFMLRGVR
ncbi:MAG: methyltransferase domain-containing protein [Clostridiales bacterium]|nr:methyltransferase domain-containing protein [Clostridiales bacterium]